MSKPVLAIDFDDTLVLNATVVLEAYNERHGGTTSLADVYVPGRLGNPAHGWNHNEEESLAFMQNFLLSEEGLATPPIAGSKEALMVLGEQYELVIVTGRAPEWREGTTVWLDRFLPGVFADAHFVRYMSKANVCESIGARILIDDNPTHVEEYVQRGIRPILFGDYPWNQQVSDIERAPDWPTVQHLLLP